MIQTNIRSSLNTRRISNDEENIGNISDNCWVNSFILFRAVFNSINRLWYKTKIEAGDYYV